MPDKTAERAYLDLLARFGGPVPDGTVSYSESPDLLIHSSDGIVGVEVTEIYHPQETSGSPRQEQEALRRRGLDLAREIHDRSGGRPVQVAVFFSDDLERRRVGPVAHELAELIGR